MSLTEFLLAQLDADEAVARDAIIPAHEAPRAYKPHPELARWRYREGGEVEYDHDDPDTFYVTMDSEGLSPAVRETVGPHIALHDPAHVLAQIAAVRAAVKLHGWAADSPCARPSVGHKCQDGEDHNAVMTAYETLRTLAQPYVGRAGWDERWRL